MNELNVPVAGNKETPDLSRFHIMGKHGPAEVFDLRIFQYIKENEDMFVLGRTPYIYKGGVYRPDTTGSALKTMIRKLIAPELVKSNTINRIYELFISDEELRKDYSRLNDYPAHWINFRNGFYDPRERKMVPHDPRYLAVNQVPHAFNPDGRAEGGEIEKWLSFITETADEREMLLQFAGYCMTRDTCMQKFLVLHGEGGTGKSLFIRLLEAAVGEANTSNVPLAKLEERFAPFSLMGKLLNSCADIEDRVLENTSVIKKALGEDSIWAEQKNRDGISFRNYAKMVFSANALPAVAAGRTDGIYRRLLLHRMDRVPEVKDPAYFDKLVSQEGYFIMLAVEALSRMYDNGMICESGASAAQVSRMMNGTDTVGEWLEERWADASSRMERTGCYRDYCGFCSRHSLSSLSNVNFYKALRDRGFAEVKSHGKVFFTWPGL